MKEKSKKAVGIKLGCNGETDILTFESSKVSLSEMQNVVNGYIQFVHLSPEAIMVVNEEGKFNLGIDYVLADRRPGSETDGRFGVTVSSKINDRITINGKRFEQSTNRFVEISKWSTEGNKMKGTSEEARLINNHLDLLKNQIRDAEMELIHKKTPVTIETIKSKLLGVDERARMLVPIFQDHNPVHRGDGGKAVGNND